MREYWESAVQILTPDGMKGSGVFVAEDIVLTAAHVVAPGGGAGFAAGAIRVIVRYLQRDVQVLKLAVHPRWTEGARAGADMALLQVERLDELGLRVALGIPKPDQSIELEGIGFIAISDEMKQPRGEVQCEVDDSGVQLLRSEALAPEPGLSGGALYTVESEQPQVVGIMTRQGLTQYIGLPLLNETFSMLRQMLRASEPEGTTIT
jgi:hypothetical protein